MLDVVFGTLVRGRLWIAKKIKIGYIYPNTAVFICYDIYTSNFVYKGSMYYEKR